MVNVNNKKAIGILGGMGPEASARLYQVMVEMARAEYGAKENHEYPEIVLQSVPVPDFISDSNNKKEAMYMLKDRVKRLSTQPLSCIGMACNTAHIVLADLEQVTDVPFVSIPREVADEAVRRGYKKVGLLASPMTIFSDVYQTELLDKGIEVELLNNGHIEELGEIIKRLVAGEFKQAKKKLLVIAESLKKKKVEAIILGCTELPLVFPKNYLFPTLDSVEILARALLKRYYQKDTTLNKTTKG